MDAVSRAFDAVLEALEAFSPTVEPAPREALSAGRALAYLDVAGLEALYGAEPQLALRLTAAAGNAGGVPASAGIASSKFISLVAARLAARFATHERGLVVPPGEEVLFLAPLPLETLPLSLRTRGALRRLRVRTLGEFAALPANAVRHRYGAEGLAAHILASGIDPAPLRPRRPTPAAGVALTFDWEETELDRLTFALKMLADQLAARLRTLDPNTGSDGSDGDPYDADDTYDDDPTEHFDDTPPKNLAASYVAEAVRVTWRLSGGEERQQLIHLAEPASTAAILFEHLRWHAEGLGHFLARDPDPPTDDDDEDGNLHYESFDPQLTGVTGIALEAVGLGLPAGSQLKLLAPLRGFGDATSSGVDATTRARHARRAIARVQARWGSPAALALALTDRRLPEDSAHSSEPAIGLQLEPLSAAATPGHAAHPTRSTPGAPHGHAASSTYTAAASPLSDGLPMWLLDPPEPVAVLTPRKGGRRVLSRRQPAPCPGQPAPRGPERHRIVRHGGPWKIVESGALAERDPLQRDYYHVETEDGAAFLLFWDRVIDRWFIQGVFG